MWDMWEGEGLSQQIIKTMGTSSAAMETLLYNLIQVYFGMSTVFNGVYTRYMYLRLLSIIANASPDKQQPNFFY